MDTDTKIQNAFETVEAMLKDRGFVITERIPYVHGQEQKEDIVLKAMKETKRCFVCFCDDKLNISVIKNKIALSKQHDVSVIIVYREDITSSAKKSIENLDVDIELFSLAELQMNITLHRLVPLHEPASDEEREELKNVKLPFMLAIEPVARYYQFKRGDVVRITRKNGTILYRRVK